MQIESSIPAIDLSGTTPDLSGGAAKDSIRIQSENRQVIQAARAVNASDSLGQNELTFFLDPRSRQAVIRIVNRDTQEVIEQIIRSGLRGRGGAGYPTGLKWSTVAKTGEQEKYVICNADEGDPGAFMDRAVL